jgi:hypothetical protein
VKASIQPAAIAGRSKGSVTAVALAMLPAGASDRYRKAGEVAARRANSARI